MSNKYYTTAIDYPNGAPHIGHAYEKVITDCYVRWYRLMGENVELTTGTDENGQKLVKSAETAGLETKDFVDQNVDKFRELCKSLNMTHTDFIRTTDDRHIKAVHEIWKKLEAKDKIYKSRYSGLYCLACETFYTENQADGKNCPEHGIELTHVEEDGYFFRMSEFHDWILGYLKDNPDFIFPSNIRKEIISRLEMDPLADLSISRPNKGWGIEVPGDSENVIYTWFDALINYYASAETGPANWPADVHVIGKDIAWFHTVIWPIMLKCADLELPKQVYVHGMVLGHDGKRMSKSRGNGVEPQECLDLVPTDTFRYYLLRAISSGQDGPFSKENLVHAHNSELANEFGNLLLRVLKLSLKNIGSDVKPAPEVDLYYELLPKASKEMDAREHHKALSTIWQAVKDLNVYITEAEPWKIKDDPERFHQIMYTCLVNFCQISHLLLPFIPESAQKSLDALGPKGGDLKSGFVGASFELSDSKALFPKIELKDESK